MLSEHEMNCMKMCQNAPNFTDFSNFSRGSMLPDPLAALATYGARVYILCASKQSHTFQTRCYGPEYRLELFSLCGKCAKFITTTLKLY